MAKILKSNKKNKITKKSIIFWGSVAAAVVILIIACIITALNNRSIINYEKLLKDDSVVGQEIFTQEEKSYIVLFYNFEYEKEMEAFDADVYTYLEYYRNNSSKENALKLYAADCDEYSNKICLVTESSNITGTTTYPGNSLASSSSQLKINNADVPVLLIVSEGSITDYKTGETAIKQYLQSLKK